MDEIKVGDYVRSYDFPGMRMDSFVEGTVQDVGVEREGCDRYLIDVEYREVGGRTVKVNRPWVVAPPMNHIINSLTGAACNGVVKVPRR